jgi:hypothetical protein
MRSGGLASLGAPVYTGDKDSPMAERIGDFLVRTGALQPPQVEAVMAAQKAGDKRTFGDIAIALGFCSKAAVDAYKPG